MHCRSLFIRFNFIKYKITEIKMYFFGFEITWFDSSYIILFLRFRGILKIDRQSPLPSEQRKYPWAFFFSDPPPKTPAHPPTPIRNVP